MLRAIAERLYFIKLTSFTFYEAVMSIKTYKKSFSYFTGLFRETIKCTCTKLLSIAKLFEVIEIISP